MWPFTLFLLLLSLQSISLPNVWGQGVGTFYSICTSEESLSDCETMLKDVAAATNSSIHLKCVPTVDKITCIEKITKGEVDLVPLEPEEIYVAHRFHKDGFRVISEIRQAEFKDRDFRYQPVAIVRRSSGIKSISDLGGKRSCHTGFGRNAGWKIPFSHLMDKKELPKFCEGIQASTAEKDLYTISNYFKDACAAGAWVPEREKDQALKRKYPNLCSLCENPGMCSKEDKFYGYEGALKCLTTKGGDVAWTKMDAVLSFFKLDSTPTESISDYAFLCWDGSSVPLTALPGGNTNNTCSWAKRPWNAFLASSRLSRMQIEEAQVILTTLVEKGGAQAKETNVIPPWMANVLEIPFNAKTSSFDLLVPMESHLAKLTPPLTYLEKGKNYSVTIEKPSCATDTSVRLCVKSELEKNKCLSLQLAAIGRRVLPKVACVLAESNLDCIKKVAAGEADAVNLSPKDSSWAQKNYGLKPILSEVEMTHNVEDTGPHRYTIALIKSDATALASDLSRNISNLRGKRSCHGSINNVAGWNAPLRKLNEMGLINGPTCGLSIRMSQLFGNKSCIPGTKDWASSHQMPWLPVNALCAICAGDGSKPGEAFTPESVCADDVSERFYGDAGTLRCLFEDAGEVAFMDHVGLHWVALKTGGFKASDYKLLCPSGKVLDDLTQYQNCNWGKVPSNQILSRGGDENEIGRDDARLTLLKISDTLGPSGRAHGVFRLFGSYFGNNDLLFRDTTVALCDHKPDPEFKSLIQDFDYCTTSTSSSVVGSNLFLSILFVSFSMFMAQMR